MDEFSGFLLQHASISVPFGLLMVALLGLEIWIRFVSTFTVVPEKAIEKVNRGKGLFLDMRSKEAYTSGRIGGAMHATIEQLPRARGLNKYKSRPVVVVTESDKGGKAMLQELKNLGFEQSFIMTGGMERWRREGLPTV